MGKKNNLVKTSLACAVIFGGVGLLAGCGKDDPKVTISDIYVTGDFADSVKEFVLGSEVSLAGAKVEISFSDGTKQTVTITDEMWNKSDYDFTTLGEKEITVKFKVNEEEKSEPIKIKIVNPASVTSVIEAITNLGNTSPHDRYMETTVDSIKNSYNALSNDNKALVKNYSNFFLIYKNVKKDVIANYVKVADYQESDRTTITGYVNTATNAIDNATTLEDIDSAISSAKTSINAIKTTLDIRKGVVLEAFDNFVEQNFDSDDYSSTKWAILQTAIGLARNEIENTTDINLLPDVASGYFNSSLMEIDNKTTENLKADIAQLPAVNTITTYDAQLMNKVKSILNTYENVLTSQEKDRISSELIEQAEAVEFKLGTIDLDAYKVDKIANINAFLSKEDDYSNEDWGNIVLSIESVIDEINAITYSDDGAKDSINSKYTELMDNLYGYATIKVEELYSSIAAKLPPKTDVGSNQVIFNENNAYNIYNNKFVMGAAKRYTIDGNTISDEENNTYTIVDGKVKIDGIEYTIITDLQAAVNSVKTKYNELSETEKEHYKASQVESLIEAFEDDIYSRIAYLEQKATELGVYLDEDVYNANRLEEIEAIINDLKYGQITAYSLDQYKQAVDSYYNSALEEIAEISNKLDDLKASVASELTYEAQDYYDNEQEELNEIINNAIENVEAIEKGENETMEAALARVQAIIDDAKDEIDAVKTLVEIHAEEVNKLIGQLKNYINVDDYSDLSQIDDLDEELTSNSPAIVVAYKEAVAELQDSINENNSLEYLQEKFEIVKQNIIDYVNRTYSINISASELNQKIENVFNYSSEILSDSYYIEIGNIREYISDYYYSLSNNGLGGGNVSVRNEYTYKYIQDYKVEDGKLYLSIPYLLFNGSSIEFNVSFGSLTTKDIYTINITDIPTPASSISSTYASVSNYGEGIDDSVGYFASDNSFHSYRKDSSLSFEYKDGENYVEGLTIVKWNSPNGINYSIVPLIGEALITIYPNGVGATGWAIEDYSTFYNYKVSVYNQNVGVNTNAFEFSYIEYVNVDGAKETYNELIDDKIKESTYLPTDLEAAQAIANEFKEKFNKVTNKAQFDTLWESDGSVGSLDSTNATVTVEGNSYTISGEGKLLWYGVDVGSYFSTFSRSTDSYISLNEITLSIVDGYVYIEGADSDIEIGVYESATSTITLYSDITNKTLDSSLSYYVDGEGNLTKTYGNYLTSVVGSATIDGENLTSITLNGKQYTISGTSVIDEEKIGFVNRLSDVEAMAEPVVTIGVETLTLNKQNNSNNNEYYGGYYEYEVKLGVDELYLNVTGIDTNEVIVMLNESQNESLPYDISRLPSGRHTIDIYLADGQTLLKQYDLHITKESAINSIKVNGESINGNYILHRMNSTNTISVNVREGYTYEVRDNRTGEEIVNLNDVAFKLGRNEYYISVYDSNGNEVDYNAFSIQVAPDVFTSIKFNDNYINDESYVDVYNEGSVTSVTIDYSIVSDIDSLDILDLEGNSLLDSQGKLNVEGLAFIRFKIKIVIDNVTYNSRELILINTNEYGTGEIWQDSWDQQTGYPIYGLNYYVDFKYDSRIDVPGTTGHIIMLQNGQFILETLVAPKGYDANKLNAVIDSEYTGSGKIEFTRIGTTNIFKLVVKDASDVVDSIVYYIIEEDEDAIDSNASMAGGLITIEEYMNEYYGYDYDEIEPILEENKTPLTKVTYASGDKYYLEGVDEYYTGSIKADAGDMFYAWGNNHYQTIVVTADFLINMDYDSPVYVFMNNFSTGSVIIVDVTSSDGTKQVRYIYNLEKEEATLSTQVVVGTGNEAVSSDVLEFRQNMGFATEGTIYGDFYGAGEIENVVMFVGYLGESNVSVGDTVTLKFTVSSESKANGVLTLTGNYNKDDSSTYLSEEDLEGVEVTVTSFDTGEDEVIPAVVFYSHIIDSNTKEETTKVQYVLLFCQDPYSGM